ncbi:MAG: hypothetical protein E7418_01955 [Ruminococcaceae bacterium]|nr:hypothetical protein [Oscillospiraceae bacterium]
MKKWIAITLCLLLFVFSCPTAGAEIIGEVLHTDIVAYVNGAPIRSFNIEGWTGIIAEDLRDYGFDVIWMPDERALYVDYYPPEAGPQITAQYVPVPNQYPVGSHAMDIYRTDIKTYVNGEEVTAFNIDGQTIIYIDWLQCYGNVVWNEAMRTISYTDVKPWSLRLCEPNPQADTGASVSSFSLEYEKQGGEGTVVAQENMDYLDYVTLSYNKSDGIVLSFSLYQRVLFQTDALHALLRQMPTTYYDGTDAGRTTEFANGHMRIAINGEPVTIHRVGQGRGNGHIDYYFYLNGHMKQEEIQTVSISCS